MASQFTYLRRTQTLRGCLALLLLLAPLPGFAFEVLDTSEGRHEVVELSDEGSELVLAIGGIVWDTPRQVLQPNGEQVSLAGDRRLELYGDHIYPLLLIRGPDGRAETGFVDLADHGGQDFERVLVMPPAEGRPELIFLEMWTGIGAGDGSWRWWVLIHSDAQLSMEARYVSTGLRRVEVALDAEIVCDVERRGEPELDADQGRVRVTTGVQLDERVAQVLALAWSVDLQSFETMNEREGKAPDLSETCQYQRRASEWDEIDYGD